MTLLPSGTNLALPTVQLLHTLPDGSDHVDWMTARDGENGPSLLTFRLPHRLETLQPQDEIRCDLLGDHRWAYLNYEGPLSGSRGHVIRLARGLVTGCRHLDHALDILIEWEDSDMRVSVIPQKSTEWLVRCVSKAAAFGNNDDDG